MRSVYEEYRERRPVVTETAGQSRRATCALALYAGGVSLLGALLLLSGCSTTSGRTAGDSQASTRGQSDGARKRGGYYLDDGPGDNIPANLDAVPDAVPRPEPLNRGTARPYTVMGRSFTPMTELGPYKERGMATWYGRRYHGQRTASGDVYDMYAMTGAHTTLPIPSYVRVTNLDNGRSVVIRINDRGPFLNDRLIDLSYVAAYKLDLLRTGSGMVEVQAVLPGTPAPSDQYAQNTSVPVPLESVALTRATPSPSAQPQPALILASSGAGHYLQLAAFSVPENAQRFMERTQAQLASLNATLTITNVNNLFRIQAGPYPSRAEALEAAERIGQVLGATPILSVPR